MASITTSLNVACIFFRITLSNKSCKIICDTKPSIPVFFLLSLIKHPHFTTSANMAAISPPSNRAAITTAIIKNHLAYFRIFTMAEFWSFANC